jgi:hypothetical protein
MTLECIVKQLGIDPDDIGPFDSNISVFHSAVATFLSPSDPSNTHGMRRERVTRGLRVMRIAPYSGECYTA